MRENWANWTHQYIHVKDKFLYLLSRWGAHEHMLKETVASGAYVLGEELVFYETSGGFIGIGPESMERGDWIVHFDGTSFLSLVRAAARSGSSERYRLVGETYLHESSAATALDEQFGTTCEIVLV